MILADYKSALDFRIVLVMGQRSVMQMKQYWTKTVHYNKSHDNNNDRLTAFDPGQHG